jgi:hypothetical protein
MSIVARGFGRGSYATIPVTAGYGLRSVVVPPFLGAGGRFGGVTGYAAETALDFDRVSRRVKRAVDKALRVASTPLTTVEQFVVERSLRAFLAGGAPRTAEAVSRFVADTISSLQRSDLERRAASQQFVEDQLEAVAQQRRDNRRRAIILVILLMLL